MNRLLALACGIGSTCLFWQPQQLAAADQAKLAQALLFHASYDQSADADRAKGERRVFTAETLKREKVKPGLHSAGAAWKKSGGRFGGYLSFTKKTKQVVFYKGGGNVPFAKQGYGGTISFWIRLTPDEDLPAGYVDPLQITDKKWNDASMFVDFTKDKPRQFRLGVFSTYKFWNPQDRKWEAIPSDERPLVTVKSPPFRRTEWSHVAISYDGFNSKRGAVASLYLNGKRQGTLKRPQRFDWDPAKVVVMLGLNYVGDIDDFAIFNRALTDEEIGAVTKLSEGVKSLK